MPNGLADEEPAVLGEQVLAAWDAFLDLASAADLQRPSRLPGWSGKDVCVHLGAWGGRTPLSGLVESARSGAAGEQRDPDADNAAVLADHGGAPEDEVLAALVRARDALEDFFESPLPAELGRSEAQSSLGPLPVLSLVHASTYELAVHALDLLPCGAPPPPAVLLDRGLAALMDVTGALAARAGIEIAVTATTEDGGWSFRTAGLPSGSQPGWRTERARADFRGAGVRGTAADLLDASAGRASLPQLLVARRLGVQQMTTLLALAPLVHELPGLPGGAALRTGVAGLGRVTALLGRRGGRTATGRRG